MTLTIKQKAQLHVFQNRKINKKEKTKTKNLSKQTKPKNSKRKRMEILNKYQNNKQKHNNKNKINNKRLLKKLINK